MRLSGEIKRQYKAPGLKATAAMPKPVSRYARNISPASDAGDTPGCALPKGSFSLRSKQLCAASGGRTQPLSFKGSHSLRSCLLFPFLKSDELCPLL